MGHIDENQLHELNHGVAPQAYTVYISNSDTLTRQEAILINSTHLSINSCVCLLHFLLRVPFSALPTS